MANVLDALTLKDTKTGKTTEYEIQDKGARAQIAAQVAASTDENADYAAEVVDARVGADGESYDSLGEAIRGQREKSKDEVTQLKSDLGELLSKVTNITWIANQYVNKTDGAFPTANGYKRTDYIDLDSLYGSNVFVKFKNNSINPNDKSGIAFYRNDKTFISGSSKNTTTDFETHEYEVPQNAKYIAFCTQYGDYTDESSIWASNELATVFNNNRVSMAHGEFITSSSQLSDFNNAIPNIIYTILTTGIANQPSRDYGTLVSLYGKKNVDGGVIQLFATNTKLFYRVKKFESGTPWSEWHILNDDYQLNTYTSFSMFENFGVIGDSYASGCIYVNNNFNQKYELSWGQQLARKCGNICTNFSTSGVNTRTWLTEPHCYSLLQSESAKQFYWLCLGINDMNLGESYIGSINDIDDNDYHNNADTFYGNYGRIISIVKEKAPNAKIIISTISYESPYRTLFNNAIIELASHFNIPYVDQLAESFFTSTFFKSNLVHYHPTAIGYSGMAVAFEKMFDKCAINNQDYFANYLG